METPKYTIKVFGNKSIVTYHGKNVTDGTYNNSVKTIKIDSLVKAFQNSSTRIESPMLSLNTLKYQEEGSNVSVILYHEPTTFKATCYKNEYENCIRPGIVIKYILKVEEDNTGKSYSIFDTKCFGVTDQAILFSSKTQLYGLPFPNISSEGWVCWGGNSIGGKIRSLTGLNSYINRLFNSPFNNHIFNNSLLRNYGINGPDDLFKYIQNRDKFPTELLENLGRNFTLGSL